jgi:hypothetical protein
VVVDRKKHSASAVNVGRYGFIPRNIVNVRLNLLVFSISST